MSNEKKSKVRSAGQAAKEAPGLPGTTTVVTAGEQTVYCRRIHLPLTVSEHKSCPYCFGAEADIRTGDHSKFCDYEEGKDPVCFGFPES